MFTRNACSIHAVLAMMFLVVDGICTAAKSVFVRAKAQNWLRDLPSNLSGNVIIVTGSNTGIGRATAMNLARLGGTVVLACRDIQKGMEASLEINDSLKKSSPGEFPHARYGKSQFMRLDLSDLHSVIEFSSKIRKEFNRVDILVNNAGLNTKGYLPNGLQQLFQVNYLGHFLLFRALEDLLSSRRPDAFVVSPTASGSSSSSSSSSAGNSNSGFSNPPPRAGRVVNLSSVMHHNGQSNFEASATSKYTPAMKAHCSYYSDSKLYMNYLTLEINRRFDFERPYSMPSAVDCDDENGGEFIRTQHHRSFDSGSADGRTKPTAPPATATARSATGIDDTEKRPIIAVSVNPGAVRSDIWRNYPLKSAFDMIMRWLFLEVEEGCATSVYGAAVDTSVIRAYQADTTTGSTCSTGTRSPGVGGSGDGRSNNIAADQGGKMKFRADVPYVIPYKVYFGVLAFEMLGIFKGPLFGAVTFPEQPSQQLLRVTPMQQAMNLWDYSTSLSKKMLLQCGANAKEVDFLQ